MPTVDKTYQQILKNEFIISADVSQSARDLICWLLMPNPWGRPSIDQIDTADFFTDGHMPTALDTSIRNTPPQFPLPTFNPPR